MPQISIIVPAYNSEPTIRESLKAIRASVYRDYELIVVDSMSKDATSSIAGEYADKVIELDGEINSARARNKGIESSVGEIIVNIDSDIVIKPDTLFKIHSYFFQHPQVDALTGLLSKEHPHSNFFSLYKNLYMYFIFNKAPERVTFIYGSIHAIRRKAMQPYGSEIKFADDLTLAQKLISGGKKIVLLKDLRVIHLKKYTFLSFIKNDFHIPFDWAMILLRSAGYRQLWKNKTGFAHSPKSQLVSVTLAPLIILLLPAINYCLFKILICFLLLIWLCLNKAFFLFLVKEKGVLFMIAAIFVTFMDNCVMALGILCGCSSFLFLYFKKRQSLKASIKQNNEIK